MKLPFTYPSMATAGLLVALSACLSLSISSCKRHAEPSGLVEIALSSAINGAQKHASKAGADKAGADPEQPITVHLARADQNDGGVYGAYSATPLIATRDAGAGAQNLMFATKQYYQLNLKKTKFVGWTPAAAAASATKASWTINGTQDILTIAKAEGDMAAQIPQSLSLNHQLTQLQFYFYADNANSQTSWGKITSIAIANQKVACDYTFATSENTGDVVFTGAASTTLTTTPPADYIAPIADANGASMAGSIMIEAQTKPAITIATQNAGNVPITINQTFEKGKSYRIQIRVTQQQPEISSSIAPWVNVDALFDFSATSPGFEVGPFAGWDNRRFTRMLIIDAKGANTTGPNDGTTEDATLTYANPALTDITYSDYYNGWLNTNQAIATTQAMMYCKNKSNQIPGLPTPRNEGWYLPSIHEMAALWIISPALPAKYQLTKGTYYSSTQPSTNDTFTAIFINLPKKQSRIGDRTTSTTTLHYVRCVQGAKKLDNTPVAQQVVWDATRDVSSRLVIDNTMLPAAALYDNGKSVPTATNPNPTNEMHSNNRVARKFAVALSDASASSMPNTGGVGAAPCPAGWRIPCDRELMLMALLRPQLLAVARANSAAYTDFAITQYWSSTLLETAFGYMTFIQDDTFRNQPVPTTLSLHVRCVQSF